MLYNWSKAAPLYTQAELLFDEAGDKKNALHARLGHLWATANAGITPEIVQEVSGYLQNPLVTTDLSLMLRALVAKAALDSNSNEIAAGPTWERILNLARTVRNKDWEARAMAEVGQIRYMDGDVKAATDMFRQATISQYLRFDFGAAFHYTAMVGNGLVEAGRPETGLQYCNTILRLTSLVKDLGFPFLAYQGKARALFALDRTAEAKIVLDEAITRARNEGDYMALSQLLVVAGTGAANSAPSEAIAHLSEANRLSQQKGFNHVFAWSTWGLATVYREMGDIDLAEPLASKSVEMMRLLEDRDHLPEHLTLLASPKTKKGDVQAADQ